MEAIGTFDMAKNRLVIAGEIKNKTYFKKVIRAKHFFRIYGGYAIQTEIINELKDCVQEIVIQEDTGNEYRISMENFIKRGFDVDSGHGKQTVVNEKYFSKIEKDQIYL